QNITERDRQRRNRHQERWPCSATMEGHSVRGILVANGEPAVEIYADAQRYSVYSDPLPVVRNNPDGFLAQTRSRIRHAYTDIIIPRREEAQRLTAAESVPVASR